MNVSKVRDLTFPDLVLSESQIVADEALLNMTLAHLFDGSGNQSVSSIGYEEPGDPESGIVIEFKSCCYPEREKLVKALSTVADFRRQRIEMTIEEQLTL